MSVTRSPYLSDLYKTDVFPDYEVVCPFRVFEDNPHNNFRSLVLPLCVGEGPLRHAVLAMSAQDRRWSNGAGTASWFQESALFHKSQSLRQLRENLYSEVNATETILACVILCCLEISSGSRGVWANHVSGAMAILERWALVIDPGVRKFAYEYLRLRYMLFKTTVEDTDDSPYLSTDGILQNLQTEDDELHLAQFDDSAQETPASEAQVTEDQRSEPLLIDTHHGCCPELVNIINSITELAHAKQCRRNLQTSSVSYEYEVLEEAHTLRSRLDNLKQVGGKASTLYLINCAETFRLAALIYLRYTCSNASLEQPYIKSHLRKLLDLFHVIIYRGQKRKLFPVWPLYIASYYSTQDDEREAVLLLFSTLRGIWPLSNIPTVQEAAETVWKMRDLRQGQQYLSDTERPFVWNQIFKVRRWKLALT